MTETPNSDLLASVLSSLRLQVRVFLQGSFCGAWALDSRDIRSPTLHLVGRGQGWLHVAGEHEPRPVRGGDLILFPHADWHQLAGTRERQPGARLIRTGAGPFTTVLCAAVEFDSAAFNPVLRALPPAVIVQAEAPGVAPQLREIARLMLTEHEAGEAGAQVVLDRLAEALFVLVLRHHARQARELRGLLAALADRRLVKALEAMHHEPGAAWNVPALARAAGMSRSAFAERFAKLLGQTPRHYLTDWRMHLAERRLRESRDSVAQIAAELGYETEAAFRRAFRRIRGVSPGRVRRGRNY